MARTGELPLSLNQDGQLAMEWFAALRSKAVRPFHIATALAFDGPLDVPALQAALDWIVGRHESLRTSLTDVQRMPAATERRVAAALATGDLLRTPLFAQTVHEQSELRMVVEPADLPAIDRMTEWLTTHARDRLLTPFDYRRAPLMRVTLFRANRLRHVMFAVVHHLVADGWSLALFRRELREAYQRLVGDDGDAWPAAPAVQCAEFAASQRSRLAAPELADHLRRSVAQWRAFTAARPTAAEMGLAARAGSADGVFTQLERTIPDRVREGLARRAASMQTSLYVLCLAALAVLSHASERRNLAVWGMHANRGRAETEQIVGWLSNNRLIGIELCGAAPLSDLIRSIRADVLESNRVETVPTPLLAQLAGRSGADTDDTGDALDISLDVVHVDADATVRSIDGVQITEVTPPTVARHRALRLSVVQTAHEWRCKCLCPSGAFTPDSVSRWLDDYVTCMAAIADASDESVSRVAARVRHAAARAG